MDQQGNGLEINQSNLGRCRSLGNVFTEEKFRHMCILSGCDYLASLHGIGLGKACKLLRLAKDPDILKVVRKMGQYLKMNLVVPEEYVEGFIKANNTFLYQLVFDPIRRKVVPLNPYPKHIDPATLTYAGINLGDEKGLQMAMGNVDINTMEKIDDFSPDKPLQQVSKPCSHSWNSSSASTGPSIWSRHFKSGSVALSQSAPSPDRPPSTRGKERVVSLDGLKLPCRELQVKRPREDSGLSDQDVLQLYTSCSPKRSRSDQQPDKQTSTSQPHPHNRFATLLQRRNQGAVEYGEGTRSRFFSSPSPAAVLSTQEPQQDSPQEMESIVVSHSQDKSPSTKTTESDGPDVTSVDTPSPPQSPSNTSPISASQGLMLFHWSDNSPSTERSRLPKSTSGLSALQQFQYKKESSSPKKTPRSPVDTSPPQQPCERDQKDNELPDSPPSQDSAYFSQSQHHLTSCHKAEVLTYSFPTMQEDAASDMNSSKDSEIERSPTHSPEGNKKPALKGSKVSGLSKQKSSSQSPAAKVGMLGPARASGLRKKSVGSAKKTSVINENSPGVQAKISSLWKNFSFKKETLKMASSSKSQPMSPVIDNLPTSSPQT
ncbi:exonuclease 1 [Xyrichtys novacula]|nr:exonuclease 1 [Xyrichtys novacula]